MGMMPAWFTTTSTKKKKLKFKSAEEKRKYYELQESWEKLRKTHELHAKNGGFSKRSGRSVQRQTVLTDYKLSTPPGRESKHYPSRDSGIGYAAKREVSQYTGDKIIGIGTLHKSNAVPVFSDDEAKDLAKMRR